MKRLLLTLFLLLLPSLVAAQLTPRSFIVPILGAPILYANLPASPRTGDVYWVSDVNSGCTAGGSTNNVAVGWSGTAWVCLGSVGAGGGSQSLQQVFDVGKTITNANSEANAFQFGDGTRRVDSWCDATDGCVRKPNPLADTTIPIWTDKILKFRDIEAGADILTIDPDAASRNAMYQLGANYKFVMSIPVALSPRGATAMTEEAVVTGGLKSWWGTLNDADTDAFDFNFPITARMVGATTATVRLVGVSKNASPSGNIQLHCALKAYRPGTDTYTTHDATGEQAVTLTPATQNRPVGATTANITINGTIADGGEMWGSCEVSASGTTSAQLADFRLKGIALVQIHSNSFSD